MEARLRCQREPSSTDSRRLFWKDASVCASAHCCSLCGANSSGKVFFILPGCRVLVQCYSLASSAAHTYLFIVNVLLWCVTDPPRVQSNSMLFINLFYSLCFPFMTAWYFSRRTRTFVFTKIVNQIKTFDCWWRSIITRTHWMNVRFELVRKGGEVNSRRGHVCLCCVTWKTRCCQKHLWVIICSGGSQRCTSWISTDPLV